MKYKFLIAVMCAVIGKMSFAAAPLAEVRSSGGFVIGPRYSSGIRILDNGYVYSYSGPNTQVIAQLSREKLQALAKHINLVPVAELKEEDPDGPRCADAPTVSYLVVQNSGNSVEIARRQNCKWSYLSNGEGYLLKEVLEGLRKLTQLK